MGEIYFEKVNSHVVIIKKDGQELGQIFSKNSYSGQDSIQICGFDRMEGIWTCHIYTSKKDLCLIFDKKCTHDFKQIGKTLEGKPVLKCSDCNCFSI